MEWRRELVIERTDCGDSLKQNMVDAGSNERERRKKRRSANQNGSQEEEPAEIRHVIDVTL